MSQHKRPAPPPVGIILLAAGYGTRLSRDLTSTPPFTSLTGTPKPLLPLAGRVLLDHWLESFSDFPAAIVVVVTNGAHETLYATWARAGRRGHEGGCNFDIRIVSDGSMSNETRLGAVTDIEIGLKEMEETDAELALIIAGDTLLPGTDIHSYVTRFEAVSYPAATFAYKLSDMADCHQRGMFEVHQPTPGVTLAKALVEKPQTPAEAPSDLASAPVYMLRRSVWGTVSAFLLQSQVEGTVLEKRDAPGFWLKWFIPQHEVALFQVERRVDIGGLSHYKDALWDFTIPSEALRLQSRMETEPAVGRAFPRVGLLGNPSDGYGGKVIAISIASEGYAEVVATPFDKFVVSPNEQHELRTAFGGLGDFLEHVEERGLHFGARSLVLAAAVIFAKAYRDFCARSYNEPTDGVGANALKLADLPNCQLTYSTTIPARIGLSGSSALILATLRALARFHSTSLEELNPDLKAWPVLIQSAEMDLLGISCGLMDRVVQVMQGCVAMDLSDGTKGDWERLQENMLPELWIAYSEGGGVGESSGKVHKSLRKRFLAKDPDVLAVVKQLCDVADAGRAILDQRATEKDSDMSELAKLVRRNFELRVALVGRDAIGEHNLKLVEVANSAGFAAKMTGSGGCALCVPDPVRSLKHDEVTAATEIFKKNGLVLHRITVLERRQWL